MMLRRSISIALIMAIGLTFGCSRAEKGGMDDAYAGTLVGGTIGGAVGLAVAMNTSGWRNGEGIAWGAVAGGLIGTLVGHHMEVSKLKDEISDLKKRIADLEAQLKACQDENAKLKAEIERLKARIAELEKGGGVRVQIGAPIVIEDKVLFAPGSDRLTEQGKMALDAVSGRLKEESGKGNSVNIEGHCDSDPIKYSHWKSNWELGAARGLAVLHYYQDKHGIQGARLSATTFGEFHPVAPNDTKEGKSKNRRSVIAIWTGEIAAEEAGKK